MISAFVFAAALTSAQISTIDASIRQSMAERHIPSVVLRIDRDGKTIYAKAFGERDVPNKLPATLDTRYQYGSVTKQFTAAAILALMSDGKLSLDDRIGKWYPAFSKFPVTIRQVLVHTAGLADFTTTDWYPVKDFTNPFVGHDELLKWTASQPLQFTPGTKAVYDNAGYTLLARIVERASGMTFFDYLKQRFFTPLGMTSVAPQSYFLVRPNTALGYMASTGAPPGLGISSADGPLVDALPWAMGQVDGAGFLVGDAADLQKWGNALLTHRVLHGEAEKLFYSAGRLNNGKETLTGPENPARKPGAYCLGGLGHFTLDDIDVYGANGGTPGFLSFTATVPSKHLAITTLTNHGADLDNSKLTMPIMEQLLK